jgi:endogenous inhibitor of DNA gyrase (YacG/DUF329 family)
MRPNRAGEEISMSPPVEACPICCKPQDGRLAPFCSRRCANIDLSRWLKGGYVIPGAPANLDSGRDDGDKDPDQT